MEEGKGEQTNKRTTHTPPPRSFGQSCGQAHRPIQPPNTQTHTRRNPYPPKHTHPPPHRFSHTPRQRTSWLRTTILRLFRARNFSVTSGPNDRPTPRLLGCRPGSACGVIMRCLRWVWIGVGGWSGGVCWAEGLSFLVGAARPPLAKTRPRPQRKLIEATTPSM